MTVIKSTGIYFLMLQATGRNDDNKKVIAYHTMRNGCMSHGLNQYPIVTIVHTERIQNNQMFPKAV